MEDWRNLLSAFIHAGNLLSGNFESHIWSRRRSPLSTTQATSHDKARGDRIYIQDNPPHVSCFAKGLGATQSWGRLVRNEQQINDLIYAEIAERRKKPDSSRTDILSLMMAARDETGAQMSDIELRDELITLLVAGHETTATSLAWAFYWIHSRPQVHKQLMQELDTLNENYDPKNLFQLPYLNAVCRKP